jgi:hypothetical protein
VLAPKGQARHPKGALWYVIRGKDKSEHRKGVIDVENPSEAGFGFFNINGKVKIRPEDEVLP